MFTSSRITRTLALAGTAAAIATTSAVTAAAPRQEPASPPTTTSGATPDRALAAERYYSSYGDPRSTAPSQPVTTGDSEWLLIGLVGAGGLLIGLGSSAAVRKIRLRRGTPEVPA